MCFENNRLCQNGHLVNQEKQTQFKPNTNPIQTQSKPKQTQFKPKQTQSQMQNYKKPFSEIFNYFSRIILHINAYRDILLHIIKDIVLCS
jgi:hypothetical protein